MNSKGTSFIKDVPSLKQPSGQTKRRALFLCPICKETTFEATIDNVKREEVNYCYNCANKLKSEANKKDLSKQKFGHLTAINPAYKKNGKIHWLCECDCKNKTKTYVCTDKLISGTTKSCGCLISKGEEKVQYVLEKKQISYIKQYTFDDCRNPKTNCLLKFDFYLPDYNYCIEYDGIQHFDYRKSKISWNTKENFEQTQYRDNLKNQYCKDHNIKLVRIPYWDYNKIDEIIQKEII